MIPSVWKAVGLTSTRVLTRNALPEWNSASFAARQISSKASARTASLLATSAPKARFSFHSRNICTRSASIARPFPTTRVSFMTRRGFADAKNAGSEAASTTGSTTTTVGAGTAPATQKVTMMDKIKDLTKQYGYIAVGVYLGISTIDLAATFVVVQAAGMDKIKIMEDWVVENVGGLVGYKRKPVEEDETDLDKVDDQQVGAIYNTASSLWSVFVIAYGIHKLLVPVRVVATSMITPPLAKWLIKRGWIKQVTKVTPESKAAATAAKQAAKAAKEAAKASASKV